jgi:hypothetical protein
MRPCDERFRSEIALILTLDHPIFVGSAVQKLTGRVAPD